MAQNVGEGFFSLLKNCLEEYAILFADSPTVNAIYRKITPHYTTNLPRSPFLCKETPNREKGSALLSL